MGLFRKKTEVKGLIGLDIGAGGIKLVELFEKENRLMLSTYGHVSVNGRDSKKEDIFNPDQYGKILKELAKRCNVQQKKVNISLPSHAVFHAIITIPQPKKPGEDLKPQIENRVKQLLPLPIEEMILDSTIIDAHLLPKSKLIDGKKKKKQQTEEEMDISKQIEDFVPLGGKKEAPKFIRVLVSGSPKVMIDNYLQMIKVAGLELISLETESFGLIRSLIGNDKSRIMIVDIGQARTNIEIIQDNVPFLHRSIKAGGADLTNVIAKSTGLDYDSAEQLKRDLGNSNDDIDYKDIPSHIKSVIDPIIHEIKYSLELYKKQDFHENTSIEKILLTGGSAHIPYLEPLIKDALGVNVYIGNPWARILTPPPMKPLLNEVGPMYAVATGLAMKR